MNWPDLLLYGSILGAHLLAVVSPGPDFFVCIRTALAHGRRSGIFTSIGFGLGILVHVTYAIAGIAVLISQSILLFNIVKVLGALYLIWIGIQSWNAGATNQEVQKAVYINPLPAVKALSLGFWTNVLNPKATLFFLGLFTLMVSPDMPLAIQAALGITMAINTTLWFTAVSFFFTTPMIRKKFLTFQKWFNKAFGAILIALGIKVITATQS